MDKDKGVTCIENTTEELSVSTMAQDGGSTAINDKHTESSHVVITIDEDSLDLDQVESEKQEIDETQESVSVSKFELEPDENTTDSDIEVLTSYEEFMAKREMVQEQLEKMKALEESQTKVFETLKRFSLGDKVYPLIRISDFHTVAFKLKDEFKEDEELVPFPQEFESKWDPDFVPMPCCEENTRVVRVRVRKKRNPNSSETSGSDSNEDRVIITSQTLGLWDRLKILLREPFSSCDDLTERMNHYSLSHDSGNVLKHTIENIMTVDEGYNFFCKVLPMMTQLCLDLPNILTCPIPLLKRFMNHSISLSQKQIACLLANSFFSTFPDKLVHSDNYPTINLNDLFSCSADDSRLSSKAQKLRCILHYFERIAEKMPNGVVTFTRKHLQDVKLPDWSKSRKPLTKLVTLSNGTIETNGTGMLQVDFANKYVGGGVLGRGAVQEEILFVIYPELLVSRLFTDKLVQTEVLLITGCERFSTYGGYSETLTYTGDFEDVTLKDSRGRRLTQFVAMDAYYIRKEWAQFHPKFLERELIKAFVGFSSPAPAPVAVATGKWGCGAFNGNPGLKFILQWMAASQAGRDIALFTFGDTVLQREVTDAIQHIQDRAVGDIWSLLNRYYDIFCLSADDAPIQTLFEYIPEHFSGRYWDGNAYVPQELYEAKLYPIGTVPPPYDPDESTETTWEEGQALLSTLDSFKLTDPVESTDLSDTPCISPSCGFTIDRNADPISIGDESHEAVEPNEANDESIPVSYVPEIEPKSVDQAQDADAGNSESGGHLVINSNVDSSEPKSELHTNIESQSEIRKADEAESKTMQDYIESEPNILLTTVEYESEIPPINAESECETPQPPVDFESESEVLLTISESESEVLLTISESESEVLLTISESESEVLDGNVEFESETNILLTSIEFESKIPNAKDTSEPKSLLTTVQTESATLQANGETESSTMTSNMESGIPVEKLESESVVCIVSTVAAGDESESDPINGNCNQKEPEQTTTEEEHEEIVSKQESCASWKEWKKTELQESKKRKSDSDSSATSNGASPTHKSKNGEPKLEQPLP